MSSPELDTIDKHPRLIEDEQRMSRRELIRKTLFSTAAIGAAHVLAEGVRLNAPPIEIRSFSIDKDPEKIFFISELGADTVIKGITTITTDGKLFYEPSEDLSKEFFADGKEYNYTHRANDTESIDGAYNNGANLFDIDANDVTDMNGTVYGEHGIIPRIEFRLGGIDVDFRLPIVLDQNETEIKFGMPNSYKDLIRRIAQLKQQGGRSLAASVELKRGHFDPVTINGMLDIHEEHDIPVMMYHANHQILEAVADLIVAQRH